MGSIPTQASMEYTAEDMKLNREWLVHNSKDYQGKYIALCNGKLVDLADSFKDLFDEVGKHSNILYTKINSFDISPELFFV